MFKYCIVAEWEMGRMTLGCFSMLYGYRGRFYITAFQRGCIIITHYSLNCLKEVVNLIIPYLKFNPLLHSEKLRLRLRYFADRVMNTADS